VYCKFEAFYGPCYKNASTVCTVLEAANVLIVYVRAGMLLCVFTSLFVCLHLSCVVYTYCVCE
jgi:hypothetical protein